MTNFEKVGLFMKTFGQEVKKKSSFSKIGFYTAITVQTFLIRPKMKYKWCTVAMCHH